VESRRNRGSIIDILTAVHPGYDLNCENGFFMPHLQCLTPGANAGGYSSLEMRVL
jgi:hypothetical protein